MPLTGVLRRMALDYEREGAISVLRMLNRLCFKPSDGSPVRPFVAEPAEPAFAAGAPPDASAATPARALIGLAGIVLLCTAVPAAAGRCIAAAKPNKEICPAKTARVSVAVPAKKPVKPTTVVLKSSGGGGFSLWMPIAADLMP